MGGLLWVENREFWKGEWPNPVGHLVVSQGDIERLETLPEEITAAKEALSKQRFSMHASTFKSSASIMTNKLDAPQSPKYLGNLVRCLDPLKAFFEGTKLLLRRYLAQDRLKLFPIVKELTPKNLHAPTKTPAKSGKPGKEAVLGSGDGSTHHGGQGPAVVEHGVLAIRRESATDFLGKRIQWIQTGDLLAFGYSFDAGPVGLHGPYSAVELIDRLFGELSGHHWNGQCTSQGR